MSLAICREELTIALSSVRRIAVASIQQAQCCYKKHYDCNAKSMRVKIGDWVVVHFPASESWRNGKLSRPWHGPFCVTAIRDPDVEVSNVYFPQDDLILFHQSWMKECLRDFPGGFYWYGGEDMEWASHHGGLKTC